MNILVFSWRDPKHPLAGGAEQVIQEHAKGWLEAGHTVTLFASRFKDSLQKEVIDGISVVRGGHQYHLGVQIAGLLYYLKNRDKYDFLVDQFHGMPFFTPLFTTKPKVAVLQEVAREVWFLNPFCWPFNWIYGALGYLLEPFVFGMYKNVPFITGSESAREDAIKLGIPQKNVQVVPHGVIVVKPKNSPSKEKSKTVAFLGVLSRDKGIEDAIKGFELLKGIPGIKFWVIGRPENEAYMREIKSMVKKSGLDKKIKFWGFVSQEKKFELLGRAHVLVNPSVREGWGLVNIEANAMGTPVVAYNAPGLVDSVKDGESGIICSQNSPESMAEEVEKLLKDKERYAGLEVGAKRWAGKFDWVKSKKHSLRIIESIK